MIEQNIGAILNGQVPSAIALVPWKEMLYQINLQMGMSENDAKLASEDMFLGALDQFAQLCKQIGVPNGYMAFNKFIGEEAQDVQTFPYVRNNISGIHNWVMNVGVADQLKRFDPSTTPEFCRPKFINDFSIYITPHKDLIVEINKGGNQQDLFVFDGSMNDTFIFRAYKQGLNEVQKANTNTKDTIKNNTLPLGDYIFQSMQNTAKMMNGIQQCIMQSKGIIR